MIQFEQIRDLLAILKDPETKKEETDKGLLLTFTVQKLLNPFELLSIKTKLQRLANDKDTVADDLKVVEAVSKPTIKEPIKPIK